MHALVAGQVGVEVDEPGQERGITQFDHPGTGRNAHARSDLDHALALDANHRRPHGRSAAAVDEPSGAQDRDLRRRRFSGERHRGNGKDQRQRRIVVRLQSENSLLWSLTWINTGAAEYNPGNTYYHGRIWLNAPDSNFEQL